MKKSKTVVLYVRVPVSLKEEIDKHRGHRGLSDTVGAMLEFAMENGMGRTPWGKKE